MQDPDSDNLDTKMVSRNIAQRVEAQKTTIKNFQLWENTICTLTNKKLKLKKNKKEEGENVT